MSPMMMHRVIAAPTVALQGQGGGTSTGGAAPAAPAAPLADPGTIAALNAQIAAQRTQIEQLTQSLVPGLSDARESAITSQLEAAQQQLSSLQTQLARALGVAPLVGESSPPPAPPNDEIPPEAVEMTQMFFITVAVVAIGVPLARAFGRWLDRRGGPAASAATPKDLAERLDRMEQGIEAIAIEVERVSEGQRFTNKLMGEMRALPAPNPLEQWPQGAPKDAVPVERRAGA